MAGNTVSIFHFYKMRILLFADIHAMLTSSLERTSLWKIQYATLYNLSAESATPLQFVVTDSTRYLLRGALYFDESGKSDSIAPVIDYLSDDIIHLIESIETRAE